MVARANCGVFSTAHTYMFLKCLDMKLFFYLQDCMVILILILSLQCGYSLKWVSVEKCRVYYTLFSLEWVV